MDARVNLQDQHRDVVDAITRYLKGPPGRFIVSDRTEIFLRDSHVFQLFCVTFPIIGLKTNAFTPILTFPTHLASSPKSPKLSQTKL